MFFSGSQWERGGQLGVRWESGDCAVGIHFISDADFWRVDSQSHGECMFGM